ncbi:hypothetical protein AB0C34_23730 [Nocardia sp. NPDC049220]|uniref:hypothetical protein n=1 Tax=Nocardia sp. NPDC049220 TaxID=3155273 RepID=UPI003409FE92
MTESYAIAISNTRTGVVVAAATVEIDATGARMTEVCAESGGETFVPEALANIDFPLLVRTAIMLSGSPAQPNSTSTRVSTDENNPQPAETDGDPVTPPASGDGMAEPVEGSPNQPAGAHERANPQRRQRAGAPADFGVNYWRLGSISKVAKHYDVPHHIAQDWIKSLQQQGKLASPWLSRASRPLRPR